MHCPQCAGAQAVKGGKSTRGKQRYLCRNEKCEVKSFVYPYSYKGAHPALKVQRVEMALNGSGIRDTARVLKVNRNTVMAQIKKKALTQKSEGTLSERPVR